mgnify:CR=1 FL=1
MLADISRNYHQIVVTEGCAWILQNTALKLKVISNKIWIFRQTLLASSKYINLGHALLYFFLKNKLNAYIFEFFQVPQGS